ncbi:hypothetical protein ACWCQL_35755 [Streptomyces sp. NPDC002073]
MWKGRWNAGYTDPGERGDGYRDYEGTVPVLVTALERLKEQGPFGRVWWRYGYEGWQTPAGALDNPDDHRAYALRSEQRRTAAKAAHERENQEREVKRRRREATAWLCPGPDCGTKVYPDDVDDGRGTGAAPGGLCSVCELRAEDDAREARERAEEVAAWRREKKANGWLGWLR